MPSLELITNVELTDARPLVLEFSKLSADLLKLPESAILITYTYNKDFAFKGNFEPAFLLHMTALEGLDQAKNEIYSKAFFGFLSEKLGVPGDRGFVTFNALPRAFIALNGMTLATILANSK